jgi:hypothetical protein
MARTIADHLHLDKSTVSRRLSVAADGGYLRNLEDKRGKPGRWVIGDPLPEPVDLLPDPTQLATANTAPDLGGCTVAAEAGERTGIRPHRLASSRRPAPAAAETAAGMSHPRPQTRLRPANQPTPCNSH